MTLHASTTALAVRISDLLEAEFGSPLSGAQTEDLRVAVARLIGVAAQQRALRELIAYENAVWDRLKAAPVQRKGH